MVELGQNTHKGITTKEDGDTLEELKEKITYLESNLKVVLDQYIIQRNNVLELQNKLADERRKCRYEKRRIYKGA